MSTRQLNAQHVTKGLRLKFPHYCLRVHEIHYIRNWYATKLRVRIKSSFLFVNRLIKDVQIAKYER